jgi:chemotaxis family two-component system response regulator Rcp1
MPKDSKSGGAQPVHIVLVEDNPGDAFLLERALRARNIVYQVTRYEDGEQAVSAMSGHDAIAPDLILLDLNLPRRDGFDVLGAVRGNPRLSDVPVGMFTSSETVKDQHRSALLGAARYIHKPPTLEEFIQDVGAAVEELLALGSG